MSQYMNLIGQKAKKASLEKINTKIKNNVLKKYALLLDKEMRYEALGYQLSLESIEKMDGQMTYKIAIKDQSGDITYEYYNIDSKLKVSEMKIDVSASGESSTVIQYFMDYKPAKYFQYPNKIIIDNNGQELELNLSELKFNPKFSADEFNW